MTLVYGLRVEVLREYLRRDEFMLKPVVLSCYLAYGDVVSPQLAVLSPSVLGVTWVQGLL